jgi:Transposase IS116/IS110/IS902 family
VPIAVEEGLARRLRRRRRRRQGDLAAGDELGERGTKQRPRRQGLGEAEQLGRGRVGAACRPVAEREELAGGEVEASAGGLRRVGMGDIGGGQDLRPAVEVRARHAGPAEDMPADVVEIGMSRGPRHDGAQDEECVVAVLKPSARRELRRSLPDDGQCAVHHLVEALPAQPLRGPGAERWPADAGGVGQQVVDSDRVRNPGGEAVEIGPEWFVETHFALLRLLGHAGRRRNLDAWTKRLRAGFHADQPRQLPLVEQAMGQQVLALLRQLEAACQAADDLAEATVKQFRRHPDHQIITSFPGLGQLTGARVLAELGDDRNRFADARAVKAYAGAAPVTRASGKRRQVLARKVKNRRLTAVGYVWAFAALTASPGARAHYDRRKHAGDHHAAAQRNLFNRLVGMLHHCLATRQTYCEPKAFPTPEALAA